MKCLVRDFSRSAFCWFARLKFLVRWTRYGNGDFPPEVPRGGTNGSIPSSMHVPQEITVTNTPSRSHRIRPTAAKTALAAGVLLTGAALIVRYRSRRAEEANPPSGKFMNINGVRLHYTDEGSGPPLVLLHGNGSMLQDFAASGLVT